MCACVECAQAQGMKSRLSVSSQATPSYTFAAWMNLRDGSYTGADGFLSIAKYLRLIVTPYF
jgi:hypothetical protein